VRSVVVSIVATIVFGVVIALLLRLRGIALHVLSDENPEHRLLRIGGLDLRGYVVGILSSLLRIATGIGIAVLAYFWLMFVFDKFPTTHAWAQESTNFLTDLGRNFASSFVSAIPGLVSAAFVLLIAHLLARLSNDLFTDVEQEKIAIPGIHPETASATRRLVNVLIWIFAGVMAYPFIPGSETEVFKGVSVFVGLLVTLGSAGIVGHLMSGLVLVYSRALRVDDYVRIGEVEGFVTEVGPLSTKLRNLKDEEFTIPNNVLVGNTTKNYSRLAREKGPTLSTSVTIGYDAPWRVVQELLTAAAAKTPGIRKEPRPLVLQRALSDFFVEYELVTRLEDARLRILVLSQLHANIQDAFNERGLQIMVPHFEGQPERRVVVPKSQWTGEGIASPDA
jgi:small-conductance mechanosensitive channel